MAEYIDREAAYSKVCPGCWFAGPEPGQCSKSEVCERLHFALITEPAADVAPVAEVAIYKKALEIAVRCGREACGTPELIEMYDTAERTDRLLGKFMNFCLEKAKDELRGANDG